MKTLTVLELSKLYNINRQTIYNNIKKGILSKNSDNKIDLAEAIRVFGEPTKKQDVKESVKIDSPNSAEVLLLRQQIDILKNQLDDAKERESFYQNQIETMQRLLEAPKVPKMEDPTPVAPPQETVEDPIPEQATEVKTEVQTQNKRIPVPEHVEPEPKKRGFLSRFFLPNG
ncbi:plasmid replication DNA-binding protein [Acinetobacter baumannii]|uniref:plasmid replication DNA-binding protein n=1 Tax=Acinetobacter baumannii TaxID=470 RepID=UPI00233FF3B0|nr:plasmid replication DNA-binding protein [Acinetobacter baumannii]MDC4585383.1 plasmid replication DNA-binding protein [Acinetobacter baumannii]MDC4750639.1 plasmid replication DNA-binding protein [Acinetobacter baumannii]MDC4987795.1 plasmid replication DNA-binding protein [Acinetobacter baumannii]MDC5101921.1 plasmid replication DNA-binding protein [Acinetobacter baumannii]MDK2131092.1 plasmid replication DNA-binding protein [Acinetobacter baumannii]